MRARIRRAMTIAGLSALVILTLASCELAPELYGGTPGSALLVFTLP
jgi:hypothetical protein